MKNLFRLRPQILLQHFWQEAEHITPNSSSKRKLDLKYETEFRRCKEIKKASLYHLDEAKMAFYHALGAVDRLLEDLIDKLPFSDEVILLGEDFRQYLPVKKHVNRVVVVQSSIK